MDGKDYPSYVPAGKRIKEFSARAIILGVLLAVILGAANAYLGLKVGMTVSASIPAAVISMGILRGVFRRGTILENNMVQTIGSAGESIAAGVIFTIPALYLLGLAPEMITVTFMAGLGGVLGLLMMIPLRRAVVVQEHGKLPFPEGTACAEVLVAGEVGGGSAKPLFASMGVAGLYRFAQNGLKIFPESIECAISGFSGAMFGVGIYLPIHLNLAIFIGGTIRAPVQKKFPKGSGRHKDVMEKGMLMSSGLVAGGAVVGLIVAILTYLRLDKSIYVGGPFENSMIVGLAVFLFLAVYLYARVVKKRKIIYRDSSCAGKQIKRLHRESVRHSAVLSIGLN